MAMVIEQLGLANMAIRLRYVYGPGLFVRVCLFQPLAMYGGFFAIVCREN